MFSLLKRFSPFFGWQLVIAGGLSAITTLGILHAVTGSLHSAQQDSMQFMFNLILFCGAFVSYFIIQWFFQHRMIKLTESIITNVRLSILNAARQASLVKLEQIGVQRIFAALANDASSLSQLNQFVAITVGQALTLLITIVYMFWLVPLGAIIALVLIVLASLFYRARLTKIQQDIHQGREQDDSLFTSIQDLLLGIKEVKQDICRNDDLYFNYIKSTASKVESLKVSADSRFLNNQLTLMGVLYGIVGVVIFLLPQFNLISEVDRTSFVIIILFMVSPFHSTMELFRVIAQVNISKKKLDELEKLTTEAKEELHNTQKFSHLTTIQLRLASISFSYPEQDDEFAIGPINLSTSTGQIIFLSGGNGSGKTTLLKLLSGLYKHSSGNIHINNQAVEAEDMISYRQLFATIFADNHLCKTLYGYRDIEEKQVHQWLKKAKLEDKVNFKSGCFSSIALSTGQRKRLSLVQVLIENKPFLILDEFAANLDPEFKKEFYLDWLPAIRDSGKTIFVISHDEHYFNVPDQHYLMIEGQLRHFAPINKMSHAV